MSYGWVLVALVSKGCVEWRWFRWSRRNRFREVGLSCANVPAMHISGLCKYCRFSLKCNEMKPLANTRCTFSITCHVQSRETLETYHLKQADVSCGLNPNSLRWDKGLRILRPCSKKRGSYILKKMSPSFWWVFVEKGGVFSSDSQAHLNPWIMLILRASFHMFSG